MKRLFHKNKRTDSSVSQPQTPSPAPHDAQTPSPQPPNSHGASPSPHGQAQRQQYQQQQFQQQGYNPQQWQGQLPQGPPGQQYVLVPVPVEALHQQQQRPGLPRPPRVQDVGNAIGWSVAMPSFDTAYILHFADYLSSSSSASKEAAKALIKEFKHATPTAQERAVRLTGLLVQNTNDHFKEQVAGKKFLAAITDMVANPSTAPAVKVMVFRVLSPLAFDAHSTPALRPVGDTFTRLLQDPKTSLQSFPNDLDATSPAYQPGGAPLDPDDPLLRPEALLSQSGRRGSRRPRVDRFPTGIEQMRDLRRRAVEGKSWAAMLSEAVALAGDENEPSRGGGKGKGSRKKWEDMTSEEKEMAQVRGEGPDGIEVVGGADEEVEVREGLEANEVVQEFHSKCLEAQDFLSTNLDWASVQASQSRAEADADATSPAQTPQISEPNGAGDQSHLASNNPFAAVVANGGVIPEDLRNKVTEEEEVLSEMLSAMTEISDALHLYAHRLSHSRQTAQEDAELAAALDRSRSENRVDRFAGQHGGYDHAADRSHDYGEGGSSAAPAADPFGDYGAASSAFGAPGAHTGGSGVAAASPYDGLEALEGLSLGHSSTPQHHPSSGLTQSPAFSSSNPYASLSAGGDANGYQVPDRANAYSPELQPPQGQTESSFLREYVPIQPSQKALGKLRRVSQGAEPESDPAERQEQLEAALREKYERNYREEQERREREGQ
ncbi:uncharacterized protein JCM10292_005005 [Rhodotorula paludigena]|uniref:uncharacterized protein n=1 Tax=Rhodotorula paludigena TaxID=86838 RepID=UPI00317E0FB4